MHREVQIKHDLMTRKCKYTLMAQDTKRAVCVRKWTVFISFLPHVTTGKRQKWSLQISKFTNLVKITNLHQLHQRVEKSKRAPPTPMKHCEWASRYPYALKIYWNVFIHFLQ